MMLRAAVTLLTVSAILQAAEKWIQVTTPNFELYTAQSERRARGTILYLEQVRQFFNRAVNIKTSVRAPTRVVLFGSEAQFKPYRINEFAAAYYTSGLDRDYIVLGGYNPDSERIATHEYVHLLCRQGGLNLPLWLNEGLAELYSTLKPSGSKVEIGALIPGHLQLLQSSWSPLSTLLDVDYKSPDYNRKSHAGAFYAESWALTHMLFVGDGYRPKFSEFFRQINANQPATDVFAKVFKKSVVEIENDLRNYMRNNDRFFAAVVPIEFEKASAVPTVAPVERPW